MDLSVPTQCATIQAALDAASHAHLTKMGACTIRLPAGKFLYNESALTVTFTDSDPEKPQIIEDLSSYGSTSIICDFIKGRAIRIEGAPTLSFAGASIYRFATVGAGEHQLTLQFNSVAGAVVGRYMKIRATAGSANHACIRGCHEIISVREDTNRIVLRVYSDRPSMPQGVHLTGGVFTQINTTLQWEGFAQNYGADFGGFDIRMPFGEINNVAIIGDRSKPDTNGVVGRLGAVLNFGQDVGIAGWGRTGLFLIEGCQFEGVDLQVSDCKSTGIAVLGNSYFSGTRAGVSGCNYGITIGVGSGASLSYGCAANNYKGINAVSGAGIVLGGTEVNNNYLGVSSTENAIIDASAGVNYNYNVVNKYESTGGLVVS